MKRKVKKGVAEEVDQNGESEAKFPYTTKPASLRRFLQEIPKRPKPPRLNGDLLKSWGFTDNNDKSFIRVLKAAGLVSPTNEPTELYSQFMVLNGGSAALAEPIRRLYAPFFNVHHSPHKEPNDSLKNLFNIHSGGSEGTINFQIQTFKALADSTDFEKAAPPVANRPKQNNNGDLGGSTTDSQIPAIQINLHIHLPENKSKSDYESIIEDIGRFIFKNGRSSEMDSNAK